MDFLRKHLEKLILGLALIALLASIALLLRSLAKTRTDVAAMATEVQDAANGGGDIEPLDPVADLPDPVAVLTDPKVKFETLPAEGTPPLRGSLYEPVDYIFCYNEACNKLIPYAADKCPFCGTEQPPKKDGGPTSSDRDDDGIPNHVEQKYPFLNPDNDKDALQDQDQDGFLNVEEFKAGTDMESATSFPPLGNLLRIGKLVDKPLPIMLKKINRNNSDDPALWNITVQTYDAAKKNWRSRLTGVGKTVDGYTIRSASFEESTATPPAKPTGAIVIAAEAGGEPYTLKEGTPTNDHDQYVQLGYLLSRNAQYLSKGGVRPFVNKIGETLTLTHGREPNLVTEKYQIESIAADAVTILRTEPADAAGTDPIRIKAAPFNPKKDFMPQATGGAGMGMGMEGMMQPGMMQMQGIEGADPANMMPAGRNP